MKRIGLLHHPKLPATQPLAETMAHQVKELGLEVWIGSTWDVEAVAGEIAGLDLRPGFALFPPTPPSFPPEIIDAFIERTGRPVLCNAAASGTKLIEEFGEESMQKGAWIVYTSADSVFQLAAHSDVIPIEEHYRACEVARELCNPYRVGRVIARPFVGKPGNFERTEKRRDYAFEPEDQTILGHLTGADVPVYAVGKIEDIYAQRGITESNHTGNTEASQGAVEDFFSKCDGGFVFANFIDFDMLYGHRRDPEGYAKALEQTDAWLETFLPKLGPDDVLMVTADHGNDPTFKGSDHTREHVPLLVYRPGRVGESLGVRNGFYDVAQSLASFFGVDPMPRGVSFL